MASATYDPVLLSTSCRYPSYRKDDDDDDGDGDYDLNGCCSQQCNGKQPITKLSLLLKIS